MHPGKLCCKKIAFLQSTKITLKVTDEMPIKDITKKKSCFCFLKKKSPKIHQAFFDVVGGKTLKKCLQMVLGNLFTALHLACDLHQAT